MVWLSGNSGTGETLRYYRANFKKKRLSRTAELFSGSSAD
jgi:hypothetical protein